MNLTLTLNGARREILRRWLAPDLEAAASQLAVFAKQARIAGVYRKLQKRGASSLYRLSPLGTSRTAPPDRHTSFELLCSEITDWLATRFPVADEPTYSIWADDTDPNAHIWLENPGVDLSWDDAAELVSDPQMWNTDFGLFAFWVYATSYLDCVADDAPLAWFWDQASSHFGWGLEMPWWLWLPNPLWLVDVAKLYRLLSRSGFEDAALAYKMVYHDTGNFFLDLETSNEAYGYETEVLQDFSVANVRRLSGFWKKARPLCERGFRASEDACLHPEKYYPKLVELMGRCIIPNRGQDKKTTRRELKAMAEERKAQLSAMEEDDNTQSESEASNEHTIE